MLCCYSYNIFLVSNVYFIEYSHLSLRYREKNIARDLHDVLLACDLSDKL